MNKQLFTYKHLFQLESGLSLPFLEIAYHTYGELNKEKNNVVWICHALTANSDPLEWWNSLIGEGKTIDPENDFIVCANILGSCYGSSGPLSINPFTQTYYYSEFPQVTIRDMVRAHVLLREYLNIERIYMCIGGSMGGYQVLEWALFEPELIENMILIATGAKESAWGIAIHTAQRMAIETDLSWKSFSKDGGSQGLKTARAIGMLTYRNYQAFVNTQTDEEQKLDDFKASSYINYQGEKLANRFNAYSYWLLTKAMDSHNLARNRGEIKDVLANIKIKVIIIGISTDILCPLEEQKFLAENISGAIFKEIYSPYGHDGFLIEGEEISKIMDSLNL